MFEGIFPKKKAAAPEKKEASGVVRGPIFVCAESFGLLDFEDQRFLDTFPEHAEFVDYNASTHFLLERRQFYRKGRVGLPTYVISRPNENDKFSRRYHNCSGVAAIGVDKRTGKNISILSHGDPELVPGDPKQRESFQEDLKNVFKTLRSRAEQGTIDVVIFGGDHAFPEQYGLANHVSGREKKTRNDDYVDMIKLAANIARSDLEIEPVVVLGPKKSNDNTIDAFLDTQRRRLYLTRKKNPDIDRDFSASQVREHMEERLRKTYPDYYQE
jgi:hypothetical protein